MKKESTMKLNKLSAEGKIAYIIKPILKVLQDAGGQLERVEIKERIADLDVRECKAQTNFAHRVRISSPTIKSFANNS
jgi:hypothetical protein